MSPFPTEPKNIKAKINRYERELRKEYEAHKYIDDSSGKRYLLGPFYLLLGDVDGAFKSFAWFEQMFPDDMGEPFHTLCWALALYRAGDMTGASQKLLQTMLSNLYLLPQLLGHKQPRLNIWHGSNIEEKDYFEYIQPEIWTLWDTGALEWAQVKYESAEFERIRTRYIEIHSQLKTEPVGTRRSQLVTEAFALRKLSDKLYELTFANSYNHR